MNSAAWYPQRKLAELLTLLVHGGQYASAGRSVSQCSQYVSAGRSVSQCREVSMSVQGGQHHSAGRSVSQCRDVSITVQGGQYHRAWRSMSQCTKISMTVQGGQKLCSPSVLCFSAAEGVKNSLCPFWPRAMKQRRESYQTTMLHPKLSRDHDASTAAPLFAQLPFGVRMGYSQNLLDQMFSAARLKTEPLK